MPSLINHAISLSPYQRAWKRFIQDKRAYYSGIIFIILFSISLFADFLSNDKPLIIKYNNDFYFPVLFFYTEETFGEVFDTEPDYKDPYFQEIILENSENWILFPPIPYSYNTVDLYSNVPNPAPPSTDHWLGTDDGGKDVLAIVMHGFRLSILFALILTFIVSLVGIFIGAIQGYFGGLLDLTGQRFIEIWSSVPELYLLIIFAAIFQPSILLLLLLLAIFGWMGLSDYVRAEFLRSRNLDYVRAAKALGVSNITIIWRHILPNSLTPVVTFLPFRLSAAILALTSLDFLGLGVEDSPSLGVLLLQGKQNLSAWWLSLSAFIVLITSLILLVFIGEGARTALDTRKG